MCGLAFISAGNINAQWKPAGDKIRTVWSENVTPENVLPEYPRPQMKREQWENLNGEWQYAIRPKGKTEPACFDGNILVPFCVESSLSGVQKMVGKDMELWYKRIFSVPSSWKKKNILLHFGAVDFKADVYMNDIWIGSHSGGYTPFSFDVTPYLTGTDKQKLTVRVWDPTNEGSQPRGKQVSKPSGIWYTPVTGIWQTVWLEPVAESHIEYVKSIPDLDNKTIYVTAETSTSSKAEVVKAQLLQDERVIATAMGISGAPLRLYVERPILWSPEHPYLYDMKVSLLRSGKVIDEVKSYTAMRKVSSGRDKDGFMRIFLNDEPVYNFGPLDQGWWPDGLYTAPTDEALRYDVRKTKEWGFNTIRKHVKVEPARWYYHCDKEGIMVWQDMPSGGSGSSWQPRVYNGGKDSPRSQESKTIYYREWEEVMKLCMSSPCVIVWVPFNESWGQFDTEEVAAWTKKYDPSRLVNPASGGNHRACGDIFDIHIYPAPEIFLFDPQRVNVIGEYGGVGFPMKGHLWEEKKNWGYIELKNEGEVTREYEKYARQLKNLTRKGIAAAVYTQTTDVEGEVNGIMTYDRKITKINEKTLRKINEEIISSLKPE